MIDFISNGGGSDIRGFQIGGVDFFVNTEEQVGIGDNDDREHDDNRNYNHNLKNTNATLVAKKTQTAGLCRRFRCDCICSIYVFHGSPAHLFNY